MSYDLTVENVNEINAHNLMGYIGIEVTKLEEKYAEAVMPVTEKNQQTMGYLHGGATIALAESIAGIGSFNLIDESEACVGMQISASHVSSALLGDRVIAKCDLVHKGKRSHVWDVNIYSETRACLISTIKVTNAIIPRPNYQANNGSF